MSRRSGSSLLLAAVLAAFDGVCPFLHGVGSYRKSIATVRDRFFPQPRNHGSALLCSCLRDHLNQIYV
jgi:hypothetical protein